MPATEETLTTAAERPEGLPEFEQEAQARMPERHVLDILKHAEYMRDNVMPAMTAVREAADKLEKVVADDLWPLPKYSEVLFVK